MDETLAGMTGNREAHPPTVIPTERPHPAVIPTERPHPAVIPTERSERRNLTDSTATGSTSRPTKQTLSPCHIPLSYSCHI